MSLTKEFDNLRIPINDIKLATNNFDERNYIGQDGFGKVYKGELVHFGHCVTTSFKRLDPRCGQGTTEFWQEINVVSHYTHECILSLSWAFVTR
ncbi:putative non-specific serine/threonine protein kinase [Helianthus annuus]|nr:putative non-specific serine/threonine protein kinase [Helianthus annuus]